MIKRRAQICLAVLGVLLLLSVYCPPVDRLNLKAADMIYQSHHDASERIVIVGIDENSLASLGRWPWDRKIHAQLLDKLQNAAAVGMDIMFNEKSDTESDRQLAEAIRKLGNVVVPYEAVYDSHSGDFSKVLSVKKTLPELTENATVGHINANTDADGIMRRAILKIRDGSDYIPSFAWAMLQAEAKKKGTRSNLPVPETDKHALFPIDFSGGHVDRVRNGDIRMFSYAQVLSGKVPASEFQDAYVLIGPYALGISDYYFTAADSVNQTYGVEVHANILNQMLDGRYKHYLPYGYTLLLMAFMAVLMFAAGSLFPPLAAAGVLAGVSGLWLVLCRVIYSRGTIMPLLWPVLTLVVLYVAIVASRYVEELREKRRVTGVFGKYVAPQVVEQILKNGEAGLKLGGDRKEISALFVDIRGFTPLSEKCTPEEVVGILNEYLNLTASSIFQFGGTLDKFIGDATMAIFNAPLPLEDHALKACQTAWAMKTGAEPLQKTLNDRFGRSVHFGIGVHTGPAVVGNIGASFRMDYTAIGDTVNTAARLESNAKPGQILISQEVFHAAGDRIMAEFLGEIKVKGKEAGVPVYELTGIREMK